MKLVFFLLILTTIFLGCEPKETNPELKFAYSYLLKGEYDAAKTVLNKAKIFESDSADFKLIKNAVDICSGDLNIDSEFVFNAPKLFYDEEKLGWALFIKSAATHYYLPVEEWTEAIYDLNKAYDIGKKYQIHELCFQSAFIVALCSSNSGNFDSFRKFARLMDQNAITPYQRAISLECLRFLYTMDNQKDSAAMCIKAAFELVKDLGENPHLTNPIYVSYADLICMDDDTTAEKYLLEVLKNSDYSNPYRILSKIYIKRDNIAKAEEYFEKAHSYGDIWIENEIDICNMFADTYARKGMWEKAFLMQKQVIEIEKQQSERTNPQIASAQQLYEDETLKRLELSQQRERNITIISTLVFVILSLLILLLSQKRRHEKALNENQLIIKEAQNKVAELKKADKTEENIKEINRLQNKIAEIENRYAEIYREGRQLYESIFQSDGNTSQWDKQKYEQFIEYYKTIDISLIAQIEEEYSGLNPRQLFFKILQAKNFEKERIMNTLGIFTDGAFRALKSKVEAKKRG